LDDFEFRVGNDNDPNHWKSSLDAVDPVPLPSIEVRASEGENLSDRVTLVWDEGDIPTRNWLQIRVKATANTGLEQDDVFYFGNAIGDTNGDAIAAYADMYAIYQKIPRAAAVDDALDIDRDGAIAYADMYALHPEIGRLPLLNLITAPLGSAIPAEELSVLSSIDDGSSAPVKKLDAGKESAGTNKAPAHDAVFAQAAGRESDGLNTPFAKLAWLYHYEHMSMKKAPSRENSPAEEAADQLLMTCCP
jgi:hypothetical protein